MATTVFLIRHAHTDMLGRVLSGRSAVSLSERGRSQAAALPARLRRYTRSLDGLYVSPMSRAVETATPLAAAYGVEPLICDGLIEMDFGSWTGCAFEALEGDAAWRRFNAHRRTATVPWGEQAIELQSRAVRALRDLARLHGGGTVAVVTHAEVIRALLLHYIGASLDSVHRIDVAPCSISMLRLGDDPQVRLMNDCGGEAE
jgi:broad specificity phosphatase PhoE